MDHQELNNHAFKLANRLHDATGEYWKQLGRSDLNYNSIVAGAANLYMASICMNAGSRENAFEALRMCMEIVHDLIQNTPDVWFMNHQDPNLN